MTAAVILTAGAGRRLGGVAKALLPHRGRSYLATLGVDVDDPGVARDVDTPADLEASA